tara:strand:+ start:311 stop:478 length:168 start_codon:yes stop_codon:yes gene_type:complete
MTTVDTEKHFENWYEGYVENLYEESKMHEHEVEFYLWNLTSEKLKEIYIEETGSI